MVVKPLIILGIDPGYGRCGWGIIAIKGHQQHAIAHGVIETPTGQLLPQRLLSLHMGLKKIINEYEPQEIAVEELYFSKNVKTAIDVGQARGVILLTCAQMNIMPVDYKPNEIKQAVTGYGQANKKQIQNMIKMILNLQQQPKLDDAADALAVALCHSQFRERTNIIKAYQNRMA